MAVTWVRHIVAHLEHPPARDDDWRCRSCRREWPCGPRKARLLREYCGSTVGITLAMSGYLGMAYQDMPGADRGALYRRFIGWVGTARRLSG